MAPVIRLEYDNASLDDSSAETLAKAVRDIVSEETKIADVFVYGNSSNIKIQTAPIEIFIEMSAPKIIDPDDLMARIKSRIQKWKTDTNFPTPINLTLIPMNWKVEIGI
jgi:hypothetical protein